MYIFCIQGGHVLTVNEKDAKVFKLITQIPKVTTPWSYLLFILNLIIPGKRLKR